ncbi:aminotransferase class IV [soil metagenome]
MIWINGEFLDDADAVLSWHDPGFVSGATVVDNCRTWGDLLFRWNDHIERFVSDCEACCIDLPIDVLNLEVTLGTVANRLCGDQLNQHVITFATPNTMGMMTKPVNVHRNERLYRDGARLTVVGHFLADSTSIVPPNVKHRSRLHWHIADTKARRRDRHAMAILLDRPDGTLTETAIGNVLAVIDSRIHIPPRAKVLDGIGLRVTLEFCEEFCWEIVERDISVHALAEASEVILTGSGFGICGVASLDDLEWPTQGPMTRRLMQAWSSAVDIELK